MQKTTHADREKELRELLAKLEAHPDKALLEERARVAVLQNMLAAREKTSG
ncbi:MAG: hypothetical protein AAGL68_08530 [Pseudomonadota bacterium]